MPRAWVLLQLIIGWMPVWALYTMLMVSMHDTRIDWSAFVAGRAVACAALLGLVVQRLTQRLPWPHPFRIWFIGAHLVGAALFAASWLLLTTLLEIVIALGPHNLPAMRSPFVVPFMILGVWLYVMVAGVSYAQRATERAARAEALAAKSQLAALRSQLNPHFLFNALHTVVQLIPRQPKEASRTAEQLAALLRTTIEEDRDLVPLAEEWAFVERYLELESVRCGDRLVVKADIADGARDALVPSFALQTLVENAVRHAVTPRVEPTLITVTASLSGNVLSLTVADNGDGADLSRAATGGRPYTDPDGRPYNETGTGLRRLRERLAALFGARARLDLDTAPGKGFTARLQVPQAPAA
jgi:hypothetical protein